MFIRAFAKFRKAITSFFMSAHPSTRLSVRLFARIVMIFENFSKISPRNSRSITIGEVQQVLYVTVNIRLLSYLAELFFEWEIFQTGIVEKITINILCSINVFRKLCRSWDKEGKYGRSGENTYDKTIRCVRFACRNSECVIRIAFPSHNGYANAP